MIFSMLARATGTPKYESGMQAYDVHFRTVNGDQQTAVLVYDRNQVGRQISETLFANHPDATDFTFREFDYVDFQVRSLVDVALGNYVTHQALRGENFVDSTETY